MHKTTLRSLTKKAIKNGSLTLSNICEKCGSGENLQIHHNDIEDHLNVTLLCRACHYKEHPKGGIGWLKMPIATCGKCEHTWVPRVKNPVACPRCKNLDWNK